MAMTRRQFLKRTGLATAGTVIGPSFFRNPLLQNALAEVDKYLVIFYLDGGNDGLNTITPADNGFVGAGGLRDLYEGARVTGAGGIRLDANGLLVPTSTPMIDANTGSQLGFHPSLQGIRDLYEAGNAAVIQGVGYPSPNLSHDQSSRTWETGDPNFFADEDGWVGRYLAANFGGNEIPGVNIRGNVAGEFQQGATGVLALQRVTDFSFPYGTSLSMPERDLYADAFSAIHAEATASSLVPFKYTGSTGNNAQQATVAFPFLSTDYQTARPTFDAAYQALGGPAINLREIAKVIWGTANNNYPNVVTARYFQTRQGGYDTHSGQGTTGANGQSLLFQQMSASLKLFYDDVSDMLPGLGDKLLILVWSEFSRRIHQNDSGTDHGTQGPVFLIGGGLNAGVYGNHPNIDTGALDSDGNTIYSQDGGNGFRATDLRDIYGTILKHWLGVADPTTLLPVDGGDPLTNWTAPNFDMGFLP